MLKSRIIEELNRAYFAENCHEKEVLEHLPGLLAGVEVFVDIGASLGQYTFHANRHMKGGTIYAFEPDPIRFDELEKNCRKWESLSTNRLVAIHAAVSDKDGQTDFFTTNSNLSGGLFTRNVADKSIDWEVVRVKSVALDGFFRTQAPDLLKIDVEGAELSVLKGADGILRQARPSILVEVHSFSGQVNPTEVFQFLGSRGYYSKNFFGRLLFIKSERRSAWDRAANLMKILLYRAKQAAVRSGMRKHPKA